jgi:glycylpeptide N-tetradecanoyltransferase
VVNALDLLDNTTEMFEKLKFGQGDGTLHYYLYNWRVGHELMPKEVGLIML